jgi:hypothetical protein
MLLWGQEPRKHMARTVRCFSFSETVACSRLRSFSFFAAASVCLTRLARLLSISSLSACSYLVVVLGHCCDAVAMQMARQQLCNQTTNSPAPLMLAASMPHMPSVLKDTTCTCCRAAPRTVEELSARLQPSHQATRRKLGMQLPASYGAP